VADSGDLERAACADVDVLDDFRNCLGGSGRAAVRNLSGMEGREP